jgi:manganese/zinc/iron transport system permease protein
MIWIAGCIGGRVGIRRGGGFGLGAGLPTGPIIVLVAAALSLFHAVRAGTRGLAAAVWRQSHFKVRVHRRQGLLAIARQEPIREGYTLRLLQREGLIRADGVPTDAGRAAAAKVSGMNAAGRRRAGSIRMPG